MIFLGTQREGAIKVYTEYLKSVAALSALFSESDKPYLHYRIAENIFCKAFDAKNWARGDIAFDATKDGYGIGIKTFLLSGSSKLEKVAEFNSHSAALSKLKGEKKLSRLVELRNERILVAGRTCKTPKRVYHCIGRDTGVLKIFETNYDLIDENTLKLIDETDKTLVFRDRYNEYSFNISKSTIFKKFTIPGDALIVKVDILDDPLSLLSRLSVGADMPQLSLLEKRASYNSSKATIKKSFLSLPNKLKKGFEDYVILPLYSPANKKLNKEPFVPEKSQLNQWNAGGRARDMGEVYISIPAVIHDIKPNFFPDRDVPFSLELPSGEKLNAKVCQAGNKALMTNPNNALADWLLRGVLNLKKGKLLTYSMLEEVGIDSVRIIRESEKQFRIEFAQLNSYDEFIEENK